MKEEELQRFELMTELEAEYYVEQKMKKKILGEEDSDLPILEKDKSKELSIMSPTEDITEAYSNYSEFVDIKDYKTLYKLLRKSKKS